MLARVASGGTGSGTAGSSGDAAIEALHTYFVTGVSGVGKSSLLQLLRERPAPERFALHDIDARGVPADTTESWRAEETEHWHWEHGARVLRIASLLPRSAPRRASVPCSLLAWSSLAPLGS